LEQLATQHGRAAARQARRICDRYSELVVGSMVHDLRTIQTYLIGHCHALISEGHKRRKTAVQVTQDLEFLHRTIADMETYTRPVPSERRPERVTELLASARELALENVRQSGGAAEQVTLLIEVSDQLVVEVARHLMVIALSNVLKNALEACLALAGERPGQVQVTATEQDGAVEIRIADNGIGMSSEEKEGWSEFVPGRRNKSKRLSTGYGLPIAARNLAAHGGTLIIESTEDVGTTVTLRIPHDNDE
jgi:signal transduction histidine kinase